MEELIVTASTTARLLENQGFQFPSLVDIVQTLSEQHSTELLSIFDQLLQANQNAFSTISNNQELTQKINRELAMQRKFATSVEKELEEAKKASKSANLNAKKSTDELVEIKKNIKKNEMQFQKQISNLQSREVQYKHEINKLEKEKEKIKNRLSQLLIDKNLMTVYLENNDEKLMLELPPPYFAEDFNNLQHIFQEKNAMLKNECLEYKKIIKFTDKELGDFLDFISNKSVIFEELNANVWELPMLMSSPILMDHFKNKINLLSEVLKLKLPNKEPFL